MVKKKFPFLKWFFIIALATIVFDQILKYFILLKNPDWQVSILNIHILNIHLVYNTGAGFGILQNNTFLLSLISLLVVSAIIVFYRKISQEKLPQILFALFLGGAVGNFLDRAFRKAVIDFIDFQFWPAFNIADIAISAATIGLIIYYWKK